MKSYLISTVLLHLAELKWLGSFQFLRYATYLKTIQNNVCKIPIFQAHLIVPGIFFPWQQCIAEALNSEHLTCEAKVAHNSIQTVQ